MFGKFAAVICGLVLLGQAAAQGRAFAMNPEKDSIAWTITKEEFEKLDRAIQPVDGKPMPLGWPHYKLLLDIQDPMERSWYEEKTAMEHLTVRGLQKTIEGKLFYQILGRKPKPEVPCKPAKRLSREEEKKLDKEISEGPGYQELVSKLKKIFKDAEAKGVDFKAREDLLECKACGTFEDILPPLYDRHTFLKSGDETDKHFLVVDRRERVRHCEDGWTCIKITYRYICGVCGAHQSTKLKSVFRP